MERLEKDVRFRLGLASALGVVERAVTNTVKKYQENAFPNCTFTKKAALQYFEEQGYTENEVLTDEIPAD